MIQVQTELTVADNKPTVILVDVILPILNVPAVSTILIVPVVDGVPPVTVTISSLRLTPFYLPFVDALIYPLSVSIFAPIAAKPCKCIFTGRDPIAQPPGSDTSALP